MTAELMHTAGNVAVWLAFGAAVVFCGLYSVIAPWRSTAEGWHLMTFTGVVGVAFGWLAYRQTLTRTTIGALPVEVGRVAIYAALAALLVWRLALLLRAQIQPRRTPTMTEPANFIPPDPDEPIPQPPSGGGATDAGLGGELVTDLDEIDEALDQLARTLATVATVAMPGAPTWPQVYALTKGMVAHYAPGRRRENVNDLTFWYYGTWNIAAAFCFIGICYALCHAISRTPTAAQQQAALNLLGGKKLAYVPYIRQVPGYAAGHSGMHVGAIVAVGGFEHIGICVGISGSTFLLWSSNSVDGDSDDAITIKRYNLSAANGHANLSYPTVAEVDDESVMVVSLGAA